jgi:predicted acyltransferase
LLLSKLDSDKKVIWLFFAGFSAFVTGNVFDWFFPINKHIWTSSYVLYAAGLAAMSLAFFVWLVDVRGKVSWTKLGVIFGSNAVVAYVLHGVILKLLALANIPLRSGFFEGLVAMGVPEKLSSLIWALFYSLVICFIPVYFLYKKKVFIKL